MEDVGIEFCLVKKGILLIGGQVGERGRKENEFLPREHLPQIPAFKSSTNDIQLKKTTSQPNKPTTQTNNKVINLYSVISPRNGASSTTDLDTTTSTSDGRQTERKLASNAKGVLTNSSSSTTMANQCNALLKSKSTLNVENQRRGNVFALSKENNENIMKTEPQTCRNSTTNSSKILTPEYVLHAKLGVCKQ